jgi:hypothetical protein
MKFLIQDLTRYSNSRFSQFEVILETGDVCATIYFGIFGNHILINALSIKINVGTTLH